METYLDLAPCLYFACSDDGQIVECNQTLCHHLGYEKEKVMVSKLDTIFTIATRIFHQTHLFPLVKMQGFAEEIFITLLTKEGEHLPVLFNVKREVKGAKALSIFVGIVVQNRKKFEDELVAARKAAEAALNENTMLQQAKAQLQHTAEELDQQLVKLKTLNSELLQFNRVVTHDLQEPLRKLLVFSNMLLEADATDTNSKTVKRIKAVLEQMRSIVSGLQQFVWLAETERRPVMIDLEKLVFLIRSELDKKPPGVLIDLTVNELTPIVGDREQIYYLLAEVLGNAVRFRRDEARAVIDISAEIVRLNHFKAISDRYKYEDHVRIKIRDEGLGFDATYKDQVFDLFRRLHPVSGCGVGLSLSKKIVENHGGAIAVESTPNGGTTITVLLPLLSTTEEIDGREASQTIIVKNER